MRNANFSAKVVGVLLMWGSEAHSAARQHGTLLTPSMSNNC
jgi:hypothetical protein